MNALPQALQLIQTTCGLDVSDRLLNGGEELGEQATVEASWFRNAVARADFWIDTFVIRHLGGWAPGTDIPGSRSAICSCYRALFARILLGDASIESWQDLNRAQVLSLDATLRRLYEQQRDEFKAMVLYVHTQALEPPNRHTYSWDKYCAAGRERRAARSGAK